MKKLILFLLLFTAYLQAQTLPNVKNNITETNTLKIKAAATVTSVNFLPAYDADGITFAKISPVLLPLSNATINLVNTKLNKSDLKNQNEIFITNEAGGSISGSPSTYESFPLLIRALSGKIFVFTRNGVTHVGSDGIINMRSSTDGGLTFSAKTTISNSPGFDCRNVSGGVTTTGRIVLFYLRIDSSSNFYDQGYIYSDDEGVTWSNYTIIGHGAHTGYSPYGRIIQIGNNELIMSWYAEGGPNNYALYIKKSTDNGTTWGSDILIANSPTLRYSEAAFTYIGGKSILCVVRDAESTGSMVQLKSTDNGVTWTNQGLLSFGFKGVSPELSTYMDDNHERWIALFYADRNDMSLYTISGKASEVMSSASNWVSASKTQLDTNANFDFGYPSVINADLSPSYLVSYYKAATVYANALIYFKKANAYTTPALQGSGTTNYIAKWASSLSLNPSSIFDNGTNVTVGATNGNGKFNVFTGLSGITFDLANQPNGTIAFSNGGSSTTVPSISSKGNTNGGLIIISGTPDVNSVPDMGFGVRKNDNTDFTTLTSSAFRFSRFGTTLLDILRNGSATFLGTVGVATPTAAGHAATKGYVDALVRPYKVYTASISLGSSSVTVNNLDENTLGVALTWSRTGTGTYTGVGSSAFPTAGKVRFFFSNNQTNGAIEIKGNRTDANTVTLTTIVAGTLTDNVVSGASIEIRVYN